jgi:hypothetical protein
LLSQPLEQHALKATAGLLYAIDRLLDLSEFRSTLRIELGVTHREMGEDYLSIDEAALKVGSDEINATHATPKAGSEGEEGSSRRMPECCREHLLVVNACFQRRALDAEPRLCSAVALDLVYPD